MSTSAEVAVVQAFLADHQKFMRLLHDVGVALGNHDVSRARELAQQLDIVAGPHIAFEEAVLYPAVGRGTQDPAFVRTLYDEHHSIVQALSRLLREGELDAQSLQDITSAFQKGLGHAEHCGTLISRLAALHKTEQQQALDKLLELRTSDLKWTELTPRTSAGGLGGSPHGPKS